jgi:hypothetical protein
MAESSNHASFFRTAARNFGLLAPIEQDHAERYGVVLRALECQGWAARQPNRWPASGSARCAR